MSTDLILGLVAAMLSYGYTHKFKEPLRYGSAAIALILAVITGFFSTNVGVVASVSFGWMVVAMILSQIFGKEEIGFFLDD